MKRLLLLALTVALFVSTALPSTIVYTSPAAFGLHDMVALPDFNASYNTPKTFVLPDATTLVSWLISAPVESQGVPFSVWLDNQNDLGSRLYVFNIQDSLPTFIGISSTLPMSRIILTTPTTGYSFTISNFQGGPVVVDPPPPPPIDPPPTESGAPEPGTLGMLAGGAGLVALGKFRAARAERLNRPALAEDVGIMKHMLSTLLEKERRAMMAYYLDGIPQEEAAAMAGLTLAAFCAVRASFRAQYFVQTKSLCN